MASKLIIPTNAKFLGKTLEEKATEKITERVAPQNTAFKKQSTLPGTIIPLTEYSNSKGMTQEQAVKEANEKGLIIASNLWADKDLNQDDGYNQRSGTYPIWTGTLVAYQPGVAFRDKISYTDSQTKTTYVFEVPSQYQGKTNCILCIDHGFLSNGEPTFKHVKMLDGQEGEFTLISVADPSLIACIANYNKADGWYLPEKDFGIPVGSKSTDSVPEARYSYRINEGTYIGLVARGGDNDDGGLRGVGADDRPSGCLGVLVHSEQV